MADGTARIFSFLMDARSLITYPTYPVTLRPRLGRESTALRGLDPERSRAST